MQMNAKNSFLGSLIALLLGSSCCWLSTLAVWIGGASLISPIAAFFGQLQIYLLVSGVALALGGTLLYLKPRKCCRMDR